MTTQLLEIVTAEIEKASDHLTEIITKTRSAVPEISDEIIDDKKRLIQAINSLIDLEYVLRKPVLLSLINISKYSAQIMEAYKIVGEESRITYLKELVSNNPELRILKATRLVAENLLELITSRKDLAQMILNKL